MSDLSSNPTSSRIRLTCLAVMFLGTATASADIIGLPRPQFSFNINQRAVRKAVDLLKTGSVNDARAHLAAQFANAGNQPHPDIILAQLLRKQGRPGEAQRVLHSLASAQPNRFDVRLVFCEMAVQESRWFDGLLHANAAENAPSPGNWDDEFSARFRKSLGFMKAACSEGCSDWNTARQIYTKAAEQDSANAAIFEGIGRCEFGLQNYDEARKQFHAAFNLDGELDVADLAMARLFDSAGQPEDAERHYRKATQNADVAGQVRSRLAYADWLLHNNRPQAISDILASSFTDAAQDQQRRLTLAMGYRMQRMFEEAASTLSLLHQEDPTDFAVSNQFALVLIERSEEALRSRALQIAEANVRNHRESPEAGSTLGWIQFRLGDIDSAKQNMTLGMKGGVVSRDTAWQMAQLHKHIGNAKAANDLTQAAESAKGPFFAGE